LAKAEESPFFEQVTQQVQTASQGLEAQVTQQVTQQVQTASQGLEAHTCA